MASETITYKEEHYDVAASIAAQNKHCEEEKVPLFAPSDGYCYRCGRQIYKKIDHINYSSGISTERAGAVLVTGCPHCHYSFCE